jgi:hypothetical protein
LLVALKAEDKRVAELPIEHSQPNYGRPSVRLPNGFGDNTGQSFFDRMFGNPIRPEPTQARQQRRQTRADAFPAPTRPDSWMDRTR